MRVHYIDEGPRDAAEVVLCLHGEPSWSYLYRKMVGPLAAGGCRVIAPDFIGFGRSDKYTSMSAYTHALHTSTLRQLITQLDLQNVTLVVQDWGGLTGLSVLASVGARVSRLVIMNTGLPTGGPTHGVSTRSILNFLTWRSAVMAFGQYLPVGRVFKLACTTGIYSISSKAVAAYDAPFPSSLYRAGPAKWPLLVPLTSSMTVATDMLAAREFLQTWQKPALIMFSDECSLSRGLDGFFLKTIPWCVENADDCHITIRGAGHFLQEEVGEALAMHTLNFIDAF
jgi:haloalkane dehalogenase